MKTRVVMPGQALAITERMHHKLRGEIPEASRAGRVVTPKVVRRGSWLPWRLAADLTTGTPGRGRRR